MRSWLQLPGSGTVPVGAPLKTQLQGAGFAPESVKWIVLSNLRIDHIGAVRDFPNARVVVSKTEREYARDSASGAATADLDEVSNWKFIAFASAPPIATFGAHVDLFGDGGCLLIDAAGSTPRTMALLVRLPQRPVFLADDMAAVQETVRHAAKPASVYDAAEWWDHIWRLKRFKDLSPDLLVVPGHDLEPLLTAGAVDVTVHPFAPPPSASPTPRPIERFLPGPM